MLHCNWAMFVKTLRNYFSLWKAAGLFEESRWPEEIIVERKHVGGVKGLKNAKMHRKKMMNGWCWGTRLNVKTARRRRGEIVLQTCTFHTYPKTWTFAFYAGLCVLESKSFAGRAPLHQPDSHHIKPDHSSGLIAQELNLTKSLFEKCERVCTWLCVCEMTPSLITEKGQRGQAAPPPPAPTTTAAGR